MGKMRSDCAVKGTDPVSVFLYINPECLKLKMPLGSGQVTEQKLLVFLHFSASV